MTEIMALKIFLLALFGLAALGNILLVGKEREPITPNSAAVSTIFLGAICIWIITVL